MRRGAVSRARRCDWFAPATARNGTYPVASGTPVQLVVVLRHQTDAIAGYCGESDFTRADRVFNGAQNSLVCRQ